jgi:hypothetical protein
LQVRKSPLQERGMSEAAVEHARTWANNLVLRESRGPGDTDNAIRRVCQRYGLDYWEIWGLRYRPPKRIFFDLYVRLHDAYTAECDRQMRLLKHERERTKALAGARQALTRAGDVLAGATDEAPDVDNDGGRP